MPVPRILLILLALPLTALRAQSVGSYLALRIDQSALPVTDKVTDTDGTTYLVEFDRLILSLRSGQRFRAVVRFRRSLTAAAGQARAMARTVPLQTITVTGTYAVAGRILRFTPDPNGDARGVQMLDGTLESPRRISVPFDYRNGRVARRRTLHLEFRPEIL